MLVGPNLENLVDGVTTSVNDYLSWLAIREFAVDMAGVIENSTVVTEPIAP